MTSDVNHVTHILTADKLDYGSTVWSSLKYFYGLVNEKSRFETYAF